MSTFREIVYLVLDELKLTSDDATFTENHIIYLINNYRSFLLKQRYSDIKKKGDYCLPLFQLLDGAVASNLAIDNPATELILVMMSLISLLLRLLEAPTLGTTRVISFSDF